ncbi:MAG: hypothetical protein AAFY46_05325, partial [Planctomycetota bacterium]
DVSTDAGERATLQWMGGGSQDTPMLTPGIDPYSMLSEPPTLQVIVRELGEYNIAMSKGPNQAAMLGRSVHDIVSTLWCVEGFAIDLDESLEERRFDVVLRTSPEQLGLALPLVAAGMGIQVEQQMVEVTGWRAVLDEGGVKLNGSPFERQLGHSTWGSPESMKITSESNTVSYLLGVVSSALGTPIDDDTGLGDELFRFEVSLPRDMNRMPADLFEATGIRLEPIETEVEGLVVRPIDR